MDCPGTEGLRIRLELELGLSSPNGTKGLEGLRIRLGLGLGLSRPNGLQGLKDLGLG